MTMNEKATQAIREVGTRNEASAGTVLIEEGVFDETLFYLEKGSVEIIHGDDVVDTISAGDVFGEVAFVERRPRTATVRAAEDCTYVAAERPDLLRSLSNDSEALFDFVQAIEERRSAHMAAGEIQEVDAFLENVAAADAFDIRALKTM